LSLVAVLPAEGARTGPSVAMEPWLTLELIRSDRERVLPCCSCCCCRWCCWSLWKLWSDVGLGPADDGAD
jgi:hypothetical protein